MVPTPEQAEATARLVGWLTSPDAEGLDIRRTWIGLDGTRLAMGRIADGDDRRPGVWVHHRFHHSDGSWPVLYAWLRLDAGLAPCAAYEEAVRLATGGPPAGGPRRARRAPGRLTAAAPGFAAEAPSGSP